MKLVNNLRWAMIAAGIVSGPALAAQINCTLTPANSIITSGETLQLAATCEGGPLTSITWMQGTNNITGAVSLSGDTSKPIYFTTPAGAAGDYVFTVTGVPNSGTDTWGSSSEARVKVNAAPAENFGGETSPSALTTPDNGQCGTVSGSTVTTFPANGDLCATGTSSLVITSPNYMTWSCLGLSGGLEANCYVNKGVTYSLTVASVTNGSITPSVAETVASGSVRSFTVTPSANFNIAGVTGCNGSLSGSTYTTGAINSNCTVAATFAAQASSYTVTASAGTGGSISPSSRSVNANTPTTFTVTANSGYNIAGVTGSGSCSGTLSGSTYTTGAISAPCAVSASFTAQPVSGSSDDPGIGSGLWVPAGSSNLYVVDQSGTGITTSYVPGCVNGTDPGSSSWAGCAANNSFTANGVTLEVKKGKVLSVRYKSNSTAGTTKKWFTVTGFDGGNTGPVYVWLTDDPRKTYAQTDSKCKAYSTSAPSVITGYAKSSTYCQISANTPYYLNIESDLTAPQKLKIFEDASDMLP